MLIISFVTNRTSGRRINYSPVHAYISHLNIFFENMHMINTYIYVTDFWATVCKTVRLMLSTCYRTVLSVLSVCPVCLSVTLVYCSQTVGWTQMKLGMQVGLGKLAWPHSVRWRLCSPLLRGHSPQFSVHICCGQMAGWIKMPLGMEVGLGPDDFVLGGDPALPPQKGAEPPFWPMSTVAKRLDGSRRHLTWRWARSRPHCAR